MTPKVLLRPNPFVINYSLSKTVKVLLERFNFDVKKISDKIRIYFMFNCHNF